MRKELVLPVTAAVSGAAGFFLRRWELASAFEADTGLPIPGMPATWALIALSAAAVLALLIVINMRQSRDEKRHEAARRKGAMQP